MRIEVTSDDIRLVVKAIQDLREGLVTHNMDNTYKQRLADLEIKMTHLWNLLLKTTPMGETKVSKYGRAFSLSNAGTLGRLSPPQ